MEILEIKNLHERECIGKCSRCGSIFSEKRTKLITFCDPHGQGFKNTECVHCKVGQIVWRVK